MKIIDNVILGLLLAPGLYASEYIQENELAIDSVTVEYDKSTKQTSKQTVQLHDAIEDDNIQKVQRLLLLKANIHARSWNGDPVLHLASDPDIMQLLLNHKANVNDADLDKRTALHWQCLRFKARSQFIENTTAPCIRTLLKHNAATNAKDIFGRTPFCYLQTSDYCGKPSPDFIAEFLEYGADPNSRDAKGLTVLDELRRTLESDDYSIKKENRAPTCKIICILDNHRKRIDTIDDTLARFSHPLISIIASYDCGNRPADKAKLDALLHDFKWLFDQLRAEGKL